MTKQEYTEYQERVAHYLTGLEGVSTGPCPGCSECDLPADAEDYASEPFFSWTPCEICNRTEGGNREPWHAVNPEGHAPGEGEILHGTCCEDCVYYLNYGRLDDTTMQAVEDAAE
jgi:hypothetical protein